MQKKLFKLPKNVLNMVSKDENHILKAIKEFLRRNTPVVVMGLITLGVFLTIILVSQMKEHYYQPRLISVNESGASEAIPTANNANVTESANLTETPETTASIDKTYGILEITYTKDGFTPKNSQAHKNQMLRITNKTENVINIEQLIKNYKELGDVIKVESNGKLEFRLYKSKLWSFQEKDTKDFGSVFVY